MGLYDGAETTGLIGLYILKILSGTIDKNETGLYRDDDLIILRNQHEQNIDKIRKTIIRKFK